MLVQNFLIQFVLSKHLFLSLIFLFDIHKHSLFFKPVSESEVYEIVNCSLRSISNSFKHKYKLHLLSQYT